ncbi:MAG: polyprenyl synthetase family protein [Culicoidibacterales bacterium]
MLSAQLQQELQQFEAYLTTVAQQFPYPEQLKAATTYSLLAGGKRIRPLLTIATAQAFGLSSEQVYPLAAAIEMIHTYSLIHDDLPAMDNDDLRRGKPTNHIVFGEATAILAGDALLTESFQQLAHVQADPATIVQLMQTLAACAGGEGMVGGQSLDLAAEQKQVPLAQLQEIHHLKTGRMIEIAVVGAAMVAQASKSTLALLQTYAQAIGLAFQIQDDILDVTATTQQLGKPQGSDLVKVKSTYVSLLGLSGAKSALEQERQRAQKALQAANVTTPALRELTELICNRQA